MATAFSSGYKPPSSLYDFKEGEICLVNHIIEKINSMACDVT